MTKIEQLAINLDITEEEAKHKAIDYCPSRYGLKDSVNCHEDIDCYEQCWCEENT